MSKRDSLGDRMKNIEGRTRYFLPRRTYTLLRLDGKAFHTYTKGLKRPFDYDFIEDMQLLSLYLCQNIQGCKIGYVQSDEISLLLTDFDDINTEAWFDGNIQKIVSVSASMASARFNQLRYDRVFYLGQSESPDVEDFILESIEMMPLAVFDSRVWTTADPWEVYNTFLWRQQDCTRNAIQSVAQSVASHKECMNKNQSELQELMFQNGINFNDYPEFVKRGTFIYKKDGEWFIDKNPPILTQDKDFFFSKLPLIPRYNEEDMNQ